MSEVQDELKPLPAEKLCNKNKPNPIKGDGPLGNEKTGHMYYVGNDKKEVVITLQKMLKTLGYDLGTSGPDKDGVDGDFRDSTEKAVKDFQEKNKDWDGKQLLKEDGLVGPKTSDALNRAMVGKLYPHYQTPKELVEGKPYHTVTSEFLAKGLQMEPGKAKNARVFLVGRLPEILDTLTICLIEDINKPFQNARYRLELGDKHFEGVTKDDGILSHRIPREAKTGKLILDTITFDLTIEAIEPADTVKGAEVRLKNLGYFPSHLDEVKSLNESGRQEDGGKRNGELLNLALERFQKSFGLDPSGELNEATKKKMEEVYGG